MEVQYLAVWMLAPRGIAKVRLDTTGWILFSLSSGADVKRNGSFKTQAFNKWLKSALKQINDRPAHNTVSLKACSFPAKDNIDKYISSGAGSNGNLRDRTECWECPREGKGFNSTNVSGRVSASALPWS